MKVDAAAAAAEPGQARAADEILDARFGENIRQSLLRHPQRLYAEEPVEQPRDIGFGAGDVITVSRRLQLALLALQPASERIADPVGRRVTRHHSQHRAIVSRGFARE